MIFGFRSIFITIIVLISLLSCKQEKKKPTFTEFMKIKSELVTVNKALVIKIADSIKTVSDQKHWGLQSTQTGLWYKIYHVGKGDSAHINQVVTVSYKLRLFDGKLCYSTDTTGPKSFILGRSGMENGLEEGLRMLRVGDSARFVLPPHLAHGLLGDQKKIPKLAIIIYDITLQAVQKTEEE